MSSSVITNAFRFIVLLLLQVLILKRISVGWEGYLYINILLYPLFILLLPFRTPTAVVILLGFLMGLAVDLFYSSPGIHASASVFTAYIRGFVLQQLEPRGGYNINHSPTKERMGAGWFFRYAAILMALHLFFYFSVEVFTYVYIVDILLKTFYSFIFSGLFIIIVMFIFNPQD